MQIITAIQLEHDVMNVQIEMDIIMLVIHDLIKSVIVQLHVRELIMWQ